MMNVMSIKTTVHGRRIELTVPEEIPDGTEVLVDLTPLTADKIGLDECEWRDDAEALADWTAWLGTIEPVTFAEEGPFEEEFRRFNVEAVRKQMAEGGNP